MRIINVQTGTHSTVDYALSSSVPDWLEAVEKHPRTPTHPFVEQVLCVPFVSFRFVSCFFLFARRRFSRVECSKAYQRPPFIPEWVRCLHM